MTADDARARAFEAVKLELYGEFAPAGYDETAEAIVSEVEPIIRADEQRIQHDGRECVCARTEQDTRERIAQRIEAARVEFGDMWVDGDLVIDGRTYRLTKEIARTMNAVREMDARIARGGAK